MYETGNPVPSTALEDMADNAQVFDGLVTQTSGTVTDRLGNVRRSFQQVIMDMGFNPVSGSFQSGATITEYNQCLLDSSTGTFYSWNGALPKVVPAGSTPATAGGIGALLWVDRTDLMLRSDINIVQRNFDYVVDMINDYGLSVGMRVKTFAHNSTTKDGGNEYLIVSAGTGIADNGSFIALANGLQAKGIFPNQSAIYPYQFGCIGSLTASDGPKLQACLSYAKSVNMPVDLLGDKYDVGSTSFDITLYHTAIISTGMIAELYFSSLPTSGYGVRIVGEHPRSDLNAYYQRHNSIKTALSNVFIKGYETSPGHDAVGLDIGDGTKVTALFNTENVFISGFKWWGRFQDNSYSFHLNRLHTKHGGLITPVNPEDYGENITITAPFIGDTFGEKLVFNRGEYTIIGGSIDNTGIVTNNDSTVKWLNGHLENPGSSATDRRLVECNDESTFSAPKLNIVMNDPGANITEHWFYCEDTNINGIDLTGCTYTNHGFYAPQVGSIPKLALVGGEGRVVCDNANITAFSNAVYIPVASNIRNSLPNWSFEAGLGAGWSSSGTAAYTLDAVIFKTGLRSLKMVASATNNGLYKNRINCGGWDKLAGAYWFKGDLSNGGVQAVQLKFYDRNNNLLSTTNYNAKTTVVFDWEIVRLGGVAPSGSAYAEVELMLNFTGATGTITGWFDGVILNVL